MSSNRRVYRIAERIRTLIAERLFHVADPRFALVTITSAVVSPDLGQAKVYWVVGGDDKRKKDVADAFKSAAGQFRQAIAKELGIRFVPHLKFFYDDTLDTSEQIEELFARVRAKEAASAGESLHSELVTGVSAGAAEVGEDDE